MPSAEFEEAYNNAKNLKDASQNDMLELYALAKIARGEDINSAPKPGMFDMTGKFKRNKWQELVNSGLTQEEAEKKYIEKFNQLKETSGLKA